MKAKRTSRIVVLSRIDPKGQDKSMTRLLEGTFLALFLVMTGRAAAQDAATAEFQPVPELGYRVIPDFFRGNGVRTGEASAVALNSKGHVFLFQRANPMLAEYDQAGNFVRSIEDGLFTHPHGLRIDSEDNLWVTDDGSHVVLKLSPEGRVLLVLGRRGMAAEAEWLFNQPTDVAFGKNGEFYVSDGYGNSRIMKFDRDGNFIKSWGKYGTGPGEFNLPHSVVVDAKGNVYVGDRENKRIQIFDADGNFLKEWTHIGYPYGLFITPDQHVWFVDGGYDRIVELNQNGKILGALGEPGRAPGQIAWGHFMAIGKDGKIYVAEVLNWRVQVFAPTGATGKLTSYVPSKRLFWDRVPSSGWSTRTPRN
jgi:DNA-binding beta-propeller fold protein YncE